jgi:hypothetical protein
MAVIPTLGRKVGVPGKLRGKGETPRLPVGRRSHERTLLRSIREKIREPSILGKGRSPKTPAHIALSSQIIASAWQANQGINREVLPGKLRDLRLKMLSTRSVLLGVTKYFLLNFMIESLHKLVGSSTTRGAKILLCQTIGEFG